MNTLLHLAELFGWISLIFLLGYYFIPATFFYLLFFVWKKKAWQGMRLHKSYPGARQIRREIKWSIYTLLIWSALTVPFYLAIRAGYTRMYFHWDDFPLWYVPLSLLAAMIIHDTLFYWSHRLMHLNVLFRHSHLIHHKSVNPTPFDLCAFQPLEALIQYIPFVVILMVVPMHPLAFGFFLAYDVLISILGHTGSEFFPARVRDHWFFRWQTTVSQHDYHHIDTRYNFGVYFNLWDRLMGTYHRGSEPVFEQQQQREKTGP